MYICCILITTGICSKIYLKFLFSYSMTGAWRWSGHPISWKQTLSLHLWVDINLIYLYCICILIFCSLRKKITRISPRKVQQQPAVCKTSAADFVTCDYRLKHIICFNQIISTYQNKNCFHACLVNYFYILWFSGLSISLVLWIVRLSQYERQFSHAFFLFT